MVHGWFAYSLALSLTYLAYNHPYIKTKLVFNNDTILSQQRQALAKIAMNEGADWTIWFDSDMRFPIDTIERLLAHNKPIVMAGYPTRKPPLIEPTQFFDHESYHRAYVEESDTGLKEIASGGFGCVAVHRSVYEAMEPPWFHIPWDEKEMRFDCGEDIYFCRKALDTGFKVYMDCDLSKQIAHIGSYEFGYKEANVCRKAAEAIRNKK
jgi:GT2 family glycosyltransferase